MEVTKWLKPLVPCGERDPIDPYLKASFTPISGWLDPPVGKKSDDTHVAHYRLRGLPEKNHFLDLD